MVVLPPDVGKFMPLVHADMAQMLLQVSEGPLLPVGTAKTPKLVVANIMWGMGVQRLLSGH